jgi:hypothetical protein
MDPPEEIEGVPLRFDMPSHSSFSIEQEDEETARNVSMAYRRKVRALCWSCSCCNLLSIHSHTSLTIHLHKQRSPLSKKWILIALIVTCLSLSLAALVYFVRRPSYLSSSDSDNASYNITSIAFVGNSILYFNDFPRFFSLLSRKENLLIQQDSCLHGGATLSSLLKRGSGMYPQWQTPNALLPELYNDLEIYDYGACTVRQLLLDKDLSLEDENYSFETYNVSSIRNRNPCRVDDNYRLYLLDKEQQQQLHDTSTHHKDTWDYVVLNDHTKNPARNATRQASLKSLEESYLTWLLETGATPILIWTHAYIPSNDGRDMVGLENVANFTSLTGVGIRAYRNLLRDALPDAQMPRIAPVGLGMYYSTNKCCEMTVRVTTVLITHHSTTIAFLTIYEERPEMWKRLFHNADHLHPSPCGTFLQACIVHWTIFGHLPDLQQFQTEESVQYLWSTARMMQHAWYVREMCVFTLECCMLTFSLPGRCQGTTQSIAHAG